MLIDRMNAALRRVPKWPLYLLAAAYPVWLLYQGLTGGLGVDPTKTMEHALGKAGLQLLVLGLLVSPLRALTGVTLLPLRRLIGLVTFFYISLHLLVWLVLDVQIIAQIWADIVKRPYITIGMAGLVLMSPLALTSNNWSMRRLGPRWRQLHKLTYVVALLGAVHYFMQTKGFQYEPLVYLFGVIALVGWRWLPRRKPSATARVRA